MSEVDLTAPLAELLRDPIPTCAIQAALALGQQQHPAAIGALVAALGDRDANVASTPSRRSAACARRRRSIALADIAESGDFFLSFPAVDALARIGDPRVVPRLLPLLSHPISARPWPRRSASLAAPTWCRRSLPMLNAARARRDRSSARWRGSHARYEERYRGGELHHGEFQAAIAPTGAQTLLDAVADAGVDDCARWCWF